MGLASTLAGGTSSRSTCGTSQTHATPASGCPRPVEAFKRRPVSAGAWGTQPLQAQSLQPGMAKVVASKLQSIVAANQLQSFYPAPALQAITDSILQRVDFSALAQRWRMPTELAVDLSPLALYDIVIFGDDSASMKSDDGERIEDLKVILAKVAEVATMFDDDGIDVRFINSNKQGNGIKNADDASKLLSALSFNGGTPLAGTIESKVLRPMAYNKKMKKPLLVITITDGEPTDTPKDKIAKTIMDARTQLAPKYGRGAVAFQFAQVGRDRAAQEFLAKLDDHPQVGNMIDCTSYYELECAEYAAQGVTLSVEAWLVKLMVGAIDPEYDAQDEATTASPGIKKKRGLKVFFKKLSDKLFG